VNGPRVLFAGPSARGALRQDGPSVRFSPPARFGDVARAVDAGAAAIGIIDGVFESERSVWHREILWALHKGIPVFGAASMGALRAVETDAFGMQGIGTIYQWYKQGLVEDDEEVAVRHAPAGLDYRPLTEATVNVRASLRAAVEADAATPDEAASALSMARAIHYKERTRAALLAFWADVQNLSPLSAWLTDHWVDQKQKDAAQLIDLFGQENLPPVRQVPDFDFQETVHWRHFRQQGP